MPEKLAIDGKLLEANKASFRRELERPTYRFYDKVREIDGPRSGVLSPEAAIVCSSLESFLGTYKTVKGAIQSNGFVAIDGNMDARNAFLDIFALYAGAAEALEQLKKASPEKKEFARKHPLVFDSRSYTLLEDLITTFVNSMKSGARNSQELAAVAGGYLEWIKGETAKEAKNEIYSSFVAQISDVHLQVNGITINGFSYSAGEERRGLYFDFSEDDIVGRTNMELLSALKTGIENILCYDPASKRNAFREMLGFPKKYLIFGEPGCGKSVTIGAAITYGQGLAKDVGKELVVEDLGNAFKSSFYSESAHNLRKIFERVFRGDASYILLAEDIDTVFFSRDELTNRPEDKAVLGELMNLLEGAAGTDYGNYLLISTTNKPSILDAALRRRLQEFQIRVNGCETIDDYVKLLMIKLRRPMELGAIKITEPKWQEIGRTCFDYGLSGGTIKNICAGISGIVGNFEKPKGLYTLSPDEQAAMIPSLARTVTANDIFERIECYKNVTSE